MENTVYQFLSFLPIISLIIFSLYQNIKSAALISFLLTTVLFFIWDNSYLEYLATLIASLISSISILMIVSGALFLMMIMERTGRINLIHKSLNKLCQSNDVLFFLIVIGLTGFFEGVSGFGTPGAIVPPILIAMGFNPVASVTSVLLFDGLFAAYGAVGTPLSAGMQHLNLEPEVVSSIALYSSILISFAGILFLYFCYLIYNKTHARITNIFTICILYLFFIIPFIILSAFTTDLPTVFSSLIMLASSVLYLGKGKIRIPPSPWIPYVLLIFLLLLPKIVPILDEALNYEFKITSILASNVSYSFKPLKSPFFPFLITGLIVVFPDKKNLVNIKPVLKKTISVLLVLFPIISVSQMMLNSGTHLSSMISFISNSFLWTNKIYIMICPFIGLLGSFITGSTTVSNIVFSGAQLEIATHLKLNLVVMLALQHSGASIGNVICLFNIVAAASVAGIRDQNSILGKTVIPALVGCLIIGAIGWFMQK